VAKKFIPVDRDQPAFLPSNMYDWVPKSHFVWFVIEVVERLDISAFGVPKRRNRSGRCGYDPVMMLTLLVYAYACGLRSSRVIQERCYVDATFRLVCANRIPNHTTISRFRRRHGQAGGPIETLFTQVLQVCAALGLGRIDVVSADGTKIKANAAKDANRTEEGCRKLARKILDDADAADRGEQEVLPGTDMSASVDLDGPLAKPKTRGQRLDECLESLAAEREAKQAERQKAAQEYLQACADGCPPTGSVPAEVQIDAAQIALDKVIADEQAKDADYERRLAQAKAKGHKGLPGRRLPLQQRSIVTKRRERLQRIQQRHAKTENSERASHDATGQPKNGKSGKQPKPVRNITDPQARVMLSKNQGLIPAYNVQVLVTADRVILDCYATNDCNDVGQAIRLLQSAQTLAQTIISAHTATGHDAVACHQAMCPNAAGDNPCNGGEIACHEAMTAQLGTVVFDAGYCSIDNITAQGPDRLIATASTATLTEQGPASGQIDHDASPIEKMSHRLRTPEGQAIYKRRAPDSEGVNASLKDDGGLRQFHLRGLKLADFEAKFASVAHNLRLAFRQTVPAPA
jgi:transposase